MNREKIERIYYRGKAQGYNEGFTKGLVMSHSRHTKYLRAYEACAQAIIYHKFKTIPVEVGTNDMRKAVLSELKVKYYRCMSEQQTIDKLEEHNITKLLIQRVNQL
jgi:hypothetical protein